MNRCLDEALRLAALGIAVFPCEPYGKRPIQNDWPHKASTDPHVIRGWWKWMPEANLAVPTGRVDGWDVLDVDIRKTGSGMDALKSLTDAGYLAGYVRIVQTPSGGRHYYFPPGGHGNGSMPKHQLDFRGNGGYVLVPPSYVKEEEKGYEGAYEEMNVSWKTTPMPFDWKAAQSFLNPPPKVRPPRHDGAKSDIRFLVGWMGRQPEGNRNNAFYWSHRTANDEGHEDLGALQDAAIAAGLSLSEVEKSSASAASKGRRK